MTSTQHNPFGARQALSGSFGKIAYYSLPDSSAQVGIDLDRMPYTVKVLVENLLRRCDEGFASEAEVARLAGWVPGQGETGGNEPFEFPFMPARVLMQDLTGVPAIVDLAAMRSVVSRRHGNPQRINPLVPVDLVIDHSIQVDAFGTVRAVQFNVMQEYKRNSERYVLLKWAQQAFKNFRLVPPGAGIVHQVDLEYLAAVVQTRTVGGSSIAFPDSLVGMDSHTTMVNGLGVLGWGVGGIEAEAVMLGQPVYMLIPKVVGVRLLGRLPEMATATDLALTLTQALRRKGVVNKFVEFTGTGLAGLSLSDRATISNMSPEYGATAAFFPVDDETLHYLRTTGRPEQLVELVEKYCRAQGLFHTKGSPEPNFDDILELDLGDVEPSVSGPRRPQDRVSLKSTSASLTEAFPEKFARGKSPVTATGAGPESPAVMVPPRMQNGSVVIAAITSCTNTSNPSMLMAAGLLAKKAVQRGLKVPPHVKTSLAPGSPVAPLYLEKAGLMPYLEALGFHVVGYGCTTCVGNGGPLSPQVMQAIKQDDLLASAVLSGNRNFENRIHPAVRAAYLASPPLVVAYALAGTMDMDLSQQPLGTDPNGEPVFLREIWPTQEEVMDAIQRGVTQEMFEKTYAHITEGDEQWQAVPILQGELYNWDTSSTYVQEPPFFNGFSPETTPMSDIHGAKVLAILGDSITTDHISPVGAIPAADPAGQFLQEKGVQPKDFNTFGARRGNFMVMERGTFGNIRLRNKLVPDKEGAWTVHLPDGEVMHIYDASIRYQREGTPLLVIAGREYGCGSSRDWAAKGPLLLGVKAVLAQSFERIHRSNLVMMGVLPLQFKKGDNPETLGLTGRESYDVLGLEGGVHPRQEVTVQVTRDDSSQLKFQMLARVDSPIDVEYLESGGILQAMLKRMLKD